MNTTNSNTNNADKILVKHIIIKDNYYQHLLDRLKHIVESESNIIRYIVNAISIRI